MHNAELNFKIRADSDIIAYSCFNLLIKRIKRYKTERLVVFSAIKLSRTRNKIRLVENLCLKQVNIGCIFRTKTKFKYDFKEEK